MPLKFPGRREGFVHDVASGDPGRTPNVDDVVVQANLDPSFDETLAERRLTQGLGSIASSEVRPQQVEDVAAVDEEPCERGLYQDLTIRDRSLSPAQSRIIGGMPGGGRW